LGPGEGVLRRQKKPRIGLACTWLILQNLAHLVNLRERIIRALPVLALLAVPFIYFAIPLAEGRAWNAIGPYPFHIFNPPEGYDGPLPNLPITAESWGASVVVLPFHARVQSYLRNFTLPLWNPYQGLGQTFAAQGEGCPYFPVAILRALLPYPDANVVTLAFCYLAAIAMYRLLRGFALSRGAAVFGALAYILSGALTLHLARPNLSDQLCMIPILFWAAARAIRRDSPAAYLVLAGAAFLHLLGGFIQIALISAVCCVGFCVYFARVTAEGRDWLRPAARAVTAFILGNGLGCFFLLPLLVGMQSSFSKNPEMLAMIPMPYANVVAFFFPYVFGQFFQSWIPGAYPLVVDWNNLFACASVSIFLLVIVGWSGRRRFELELHRRLFIFFTALGLFLLLRYLSFPPLAVVNMLPILGRQSPKHANGLTVFCFAVAAAFAAHSLRTLWTRRTQVWLTGSVLAIGSCVLTLVVRQGGWAAVDLKLAPVALTVTAVVVVLVWFWLWCASRLPGDGFIWLPVTVLVAEEGLYLALGTAQSELLYGRLAVFAGVSCAGLLFAQRKYWPGAAVVVLGLGFYAGLIVPRSNLPGNEDLTKPPASLLWLRAHLGNDGRSWGIQPDLSSLARIQDLGAIGPLAPAAFNEFVRATSDDATYGNYRVSCYNLLGAYYWSFPLAQYVRTKPLFDFAGVRYLFLNKSYFGPGKRQDDAALLKSEPGLSVAYEDDFVRILESKAARPKLTLYPELEVLPDHAAVLQRLKSEPASILGPAIITEADRPAPTSSPGAPGSSATIDFASYRPNVVVARVNSPRPSLLVLNDVYDDGWHVTVDGSERPLVQANGFFRGVYLAEAGAHEVRFFYRPPSFTHGLWLSAAVAFFLLVGGSAIWRSGPPEKALPTLRPGAGIAAPWAWELAGVALAGLVLLAIVATYFLNA